MDTRTGEIGPYADLVTRVPQQFLVPILDKPQEPAPKPDREAPGDLERRLVPKNQVITGMLWSELPLKTQLQVAATGRAFLSRNSKCPCGSGLRFKRCCLAKEDV